MTGGYSSDKSHSEVLRVSTVDFSIEKHSDMIGARDSHAIVMMDHCPIVIAGY